MDFNDASPQSSPDYHELIRNGAPVGQRSEAFQAVVWHLAKPRPERRADRCRAGEASQRHWRKICGRLHDEVSRSHNKWRAHKRTAATGGQAASSDPWAAKSSSRGGELPRVVDEAEEALLLLGREIYQRGGLDRSASAAEGPRERRTVKLRAGVLIPDVAPLHGQTLTCAAQFFKFDRASKPLSQLSRRISSRNLSVAARPVGGSRCLRASCTRRSCVADGSLCEPAGIRRESGLLFKPDGQHFTSIPQQPSKAERCKHWR